MANLSRDPPWAISWRYLRCAGHKIGRDSLAVASSVVPSWLFKAPTNSWRGWVPRSGSPCAAQARARPRVARNSNARDCCGLAAAMAISNSHTFWLKFLARPAAVRRFASKRGWEVFRHDKRQDRQAILALLAAALNDCASCVGRQSACSQHPPPSRPRRYKLYEDAPSPPSPHETAVLANLCPTAGLGLVGECGDLNFPAQTAGQSKMFASRPD